MKRFRECRSWSESPDFLFGLGCRIRVEVPSVLSFRGILPQIPESMLRNAKNKSFCNGSKGLKAVEGKRENAGWIRLSASGVWLWDSSFLKKLGFLFA